MANRQLDICVVLENVNDDHNIGAVMRSCDSIGIQELYVLNSLPDNKKKFIKVGKRTSAGTRKWLSVQYFTDVEACFKHIKSKYDVVAGTILGSTSVDLFEMDLTKSYAFVFGNEKLGISDLCKHHIDTNFIIPQLGMAQSLNISVACAITLYECYRQRMEAGYYNSNEAFGPEKELLLEHYNQRSKVKPIRYIDYKLFPANDNPVSKKS